MNKLNPFRSGKDKHSDSSDDDTPAASDKSSGHKQVLKPSSRCTHVVKGNERLSSAASILMCPRLPQNAMMGAMSKLNPFKPANKVTRLSIASASFMVTVQDVGPRLVMES